MDKWTPELFAYHNLTLGSWDNQTSSSTHLVGPFWPGLAWQGRTSR